MCIEECQCSLEIRRFRNNDLENLERIRNNVEKWNRIMQRLTIYTSVLKPVASISEQ